MKNIVTIVLCLLLSISACKKVETSIKEVEDVNGLSSFESKISKGVSLVFYHASWCSICKEQRPAVQETAKNESFSNVFFGQVEFEDNSEINQKYDVNGFPTTVIYQDGVEKERLNGKGHSAEEIQTLLNKYL